MLNALQMFYMTCLSATILTRVADPARHFDADADPDLGPDPAYHFVADADPDPSFQIKAQKTDERLIFYTF